LLGLVSVASFGYLCFFFFIFDLLVRGSPHHLVLVRPFVALFIKKGESLFRGHTWELDIASLNLLHT
jgi:hypothetical protein